MRACDRGRRVRRLLAAAIVLWGMPPRHVGASPAVAEQVAATGLPDTVELKNGGFIRGVVTEFIPGSHVLVQTADGQARRIPAHDVAEVQRGAAAPSDPSLVSDDAPKQTSLDRTLAAIAGPRLRLKVTANKAAALERRISIDGRAPDDSDTVAYHLVCQAPCTAELPAQDVELYRVHAASAQPTDWFTLPAGDAAVHADLVHHSWTLLPRALLYSGLVFAGASGVFFGLHETDVASGWSATTGTVFAIGAATSLVASGLIWALRPRSKMKLSPDM